MPNPIVFNLNFTIDPNKPLQWIRANEFLDGEKTFTASLGGPFIAFFSYKPYSLYSEVKVSVWVGNHPIYEDFYDSQNGLMDARQRIEPWYFQCLENLWKEMTT